MVKLFKLLEVLLLLDFSPNASKIYTIVPTA